MPVALEICFCARCPMVAVVSGTKMKPIATPLRTLGQATLRQATSRLIWLCHRDDKASSEKPVIIR